MSLILFCAFLMFFFNSRALNPKRTLEITLLKRRLSRLDNKNQDLRLREHLALSKISACYDRVIEHLPMEGSVVTSRLIQETLKKQLKPKTLVFNGSNKLHKQFIVDNYPRVPKE